jgi:hypothetical protein
LNRVLENLHHVKGGYSIVNVTSIEVEHMVEIEEEERKLVGDVKLR